MSLRSWWKRLWTSDEDLQQKPAFPLTVAADDYLFIKTPGVPPSGKWCSASGLSAWLPDPIKLTPGKIYQHKESGRIATYRGKMTSPSYNENIAEHLRSLPKRNGRTPEMTGLGPVDDDTWFDMITGEQFVDNDIQNWQPAGKVEVGE
jgi:hypothetical protein